MGYTAIAGASKATVSQMVAYIKDRNSNVAQSVIDMIPYYLSEGAAEGIRGDIAFAQSCLETGNFTFVGSAVTLSQNNFCGLGVVKNGLKGNSFSTPRLGIRAQIQHLKAYANKEPLVNPCIDPRFSYVERGCIPYVDTLGIQENPKKQGWSAGTNYGPQILTILSNILKFEGTEEMAKTKTTINYMNKAAAAADKVYAKIVSLKCKHKSGAKTWDQMVKQKIVTCATSASITYQEAGILEPGKTFGHYDAVGGTAANILKKKPTIAKAMKGAANIPASKADVVYVGKKYAELPKKYRQKGCAYIQDSNVCVCAGNGAIYSCNAATGSQLDSKGRYKNDKITSGYAFNSPILVVIAPKTVEVVSTVTTTSTKANTSTTITKEEVFDMSTLKQGATGQQVKALQKLLGGLDVDGEFGPLTKAAVESYQEKHKLDVDGIVGPKTWDSILAS